jgi:hypothetical protein
MFEFLDGVAVKGQLQNQHECTGSLQHIYTTNKNNVHHVISMSYGSIAITRNNLKQGEESSIMMIIQKILID